MFLLLPFITLITSFKSIVSLKNENISNCNLQIIQNYTLRTIYESNETNCDCLPRDLTNITNSTYINVLNCTLKCFKNNPTKFKDFVKNVKDIIPIFDNLDLTKMQKIIVNITKKIVYNDTMLEQIDNILTKTNFSDIMIEFLNLPDHLKNITNIKNFVCRITNIKGFFELFIGVYKSSTKDFLDLIEEFIKGNLEKFTLKAFNLVRTKLGDFIDDVIIFIYKLFEDMEDKNKIFDHIAHLIIKHNSSYDKIKEVIMDDATANLLEK